jgi:predicted MPP superfamily phosphohydrolase
MVAITGDVVDGSVLELAHHTEPLGRLESRHGTYVVTGNHEYYSGAHAWINELRRLGTRVLLNEHVVLDHDGAKVAVAGVTDYSAHHFDPSHKSDPHAAVKGAPTGALKVLLAHQPRSASSAADAGYDLQLSGHTHGGQFWPWNLFVRLQQPFTAGLNRLGRMWVYINRGDHTDSTCQGLAAEASLFTDRYHCDDGSWAPLMINTIGDENTNQYLKATFCVQLAHSI